MRRGREGNNKYGREIMRKNPDSAAAIHGGEQQGKISCALWVGGACSLTFSLSLSCQSRQPYTVVDGCELMYEEESRQKFLFVYHLRCISFLLLYKTEKSLARS